jgi:hypothetical protein
MSNEKDVGTIKCKVVADKVWYSKESRFLMQGDEVDFPAKVKNYKGELVDFKVGESFEVVEPEPQGKKAKQPGGKADDLV